MNEFWQRALMPVGLLLVLALLLWAAVGAAWGWGLMTLGLLALLVWHLRQAEAFDRWLSDESETVPEGAGMWEDIFASLNRVVKHHRLTEARLTSALQHLEQATAALPEGVIILDEGDHIEWCNPLAQQHFGLDPKHDIGQQITYLARQPEFGQYLAARQFADPLILRGARHDGLILSIKLIPYGAEQHLLISRDVTQLERLENMRRDFVANVSHEMRTPLTVVSGFIETLIDMPDVNNEAARRGLQLMGEQTARMAHLVDDLLTLSRLENSGAHMQEESVRIEPLLRKVCDEGERLSKGQHRIELTIASEADLLGNAADLHSAFGNLVSNAIRYTPPGGLIQIRWEEQDGAPVFAVKDSGIGIAPQHIPRLTERFYRVDRSRSRETGGTGLGLAIVKHIVNRHQARFEVESREGAGSTFSLRFPAQRRLSHPA